MLNFVGIGAQKAGTTWLYSNLSKCPNIQFPAGKEVHFWDIHYGQGIDWYKNQFLNVPEDTICGDITPAYAILPPQKIKEAYAAFPDAKIIYILRNPIERAWAAALMALSRAEMTIDEASDQWFIDHFNSQGSMQRGDYLACLQNWLAIYPKKQIMILLYDDISTSSEYVLQNVLQHIGVQYNHNILDSKSVKQKIFTGTGATIRPKLTTYLESIYRNKVIELSGFLQSHECFYTSNKDVNWLNQLHKISS